MASITLALWLVLLWNFLLTTDVGPERVSVLGRTVDIELGFYEWEGEGRLVAEVWRFRISGVATPRKKRQPRRRRL